MLYVFLFYIIKKDTSYMLRIAGITADPIGLNFFVDTHGGAKKIQKLFSSSYLQLLTYEG